MGRWAARGGAHYAEAGLGELVGLPGPTEGAEPPGTCMSSATLSRRAWNRRSRALGSATRPTIACRSIVRPRCAHGVTALSCPGTEEAARTHLAIPMSPALSRAQVDEVVATVATAEQ